MGRWAGISACPDVLVGSFGALVASVESVFMSPFLRKVKTTSGATAVQVVEKRHGQRRILEHLGSAHTEAELAALLQVGRDKLAANQPALDFDDDSGGRLRSTGVVVEGKSSRLLVEVICSVWDRLGFGRIEDETFFQLVLARLVEPTSKLDSLQVIEELGITPSHHNTYYKSLQRCAAKEYREQLAAASVAHVWNQPGRDVSLLLYDVTTLYFEAEKEDGLRKVGFSKERRVDPQIVVGMLVDRLGHLLEIACFEGNKPETHTIIPVVRALPGASQGRGHGRGCGCRDALRQQPGSHRSSGVAVLHRFPGHPHFARPGQPLPLAWHRLRRWADYRHHHLSPRRPGPPTGEVATRASLGPRPAQQP